MSLWVSCEFSVFRHSQRFLKNLIDNYLIFSFYFLPPCLDLNSLLSFNFDMIEWTNDIIDCSDLDVVTCDFYRSLHVTVIDVDQMLPVIKVLHDGVLYIVSFCKTFSTLDWTQLENFSSPDLLKCKLNPGSCCLLKNLVVSL